MEYMTFLSFLQYKDLMFFVVVVLDLVFLGGGGKEEVF